MTPTITATGRERLAALERHLRTGTLGHVRFNFGVYNGGPIDPATRCGTLGCALGEMPFVDPARWSFDEEYLHPVMDGDADADPKAAAVRYFGLGGDGLAAVHHLFFPDSQTPKNFGGRRLDRSATRFDVADNIAAFLALAETEP